MRGIICTACTIESINRMSSLCIFEKLGLNVIVSSSANIQEISKPGLDLCAVKKRRGFALNLFL